MRIWPKRVCPPPLQWLFNLPLPALHCPSLGCTKSLKMLLAGSAGKKFEFRPGRAGPGHAMPCHARPGQHAPLIYVGPGAAPACVMDGVDLVWVCSEMGNGVPVGVLSVCLLRGWWVVTGDRRRWVHRSIE